MDRVDFAAMPVAELVGACLACSARAQRALFERYETRLNGFIAHILENGDAEQVYDLVMEAFARMFRALATFDCSRPFEPSLFAIARNLVWDHLRKRRSETVDLEEMNDVADDP